MKRVFMIALTAAIALLGSCSRYKIIPEAELAKIFHDAMLINAYVGLEGINIDSLNIYEPIFEKYGYSTGDIRHTINSFSRRKNARLGDVAEYMITQFELESHALKQGVAKLDTINNVAERRFHTTIYEKKEVEIKGERDSSLLHYYVPINGEGLYDFNFRYTINEPDDVRGRRMVIYKVRRDSSKILLFQNQMYVDRTNSANTRQRIESDRDSNIIAFYIYLNDRQRVIKRDSKKPAHLTLHELKVEFQPPTEECIRMLFDEQTNLRILSDTMLRANEQAALRAEETARR